MTVIILTSGTSWNVPADWTNTNQIETWGAGGGGAGDGANGGGAGGGGAWNSISNKTGLSGSITINIGTGGTASNGGTAGTGGDTWFNGASLGASSVGSKGGGGGDFGASAPGVGGSGGSGAGGVGTSSNNGGAGGNGGDDPTFGGPGGGGGGAAGPAGAGNAGATPPTGTGNDTGGNGGSGDNGSGGSAGTGGTSGSHNGGAGGASNDGGGGGGGAFANNGSGNIGGAGGLPGGGGGGGDNGGPNGIGGVGAGGQIRITYTPLAGGVPPFWTDLPPSRYRDRWLKLDEQYDMKGWQQSPLSASTPDTRGMVYDLPPIGRFNWTKYQDRQQAAVRDNQPIAAGCRWEEVPPGHFNPIKYQDWQRGVIPDEYLVPLPWTDVPKGRYNAARYQDIQQSPRPGDVVLPPILPWTDLPQRTWDRRNLYYYSGVQLAPQPEIMSPPQPVYDVPPGHWNVARFQDWQHTFQPLEYQAPLPQVDVPRGVVKHSYVGWQNYQTPSDVAPPLQSSYSYDLPPVGRLQQQAKNMQLFQGAGVAPTPGNVFPVIPAMWLPLIGVGNQGP